MSLTFYRGQPSQSSVQSGSAIITSSPTSAANQMIPLLTQQQFETEIWNNEPTNRDITHIIYFTKNDCIPCSRLDLPALTSITESYTPSANVKWYKCNLDTNKYTPPFCNVYKVPTFISIRNKFIHGRITSSINETVADWVYEQLAQIITGSA